MNGSPAPLCALRGCDMDGTLRIITEADAQAHALARAPALAEVAARIARGGRHGVQVDAADALGVAYLAALDAVRAGRETDPRELARAITRELRGDRHEVTAVHADARPTRSLRRKCRSLILRPAERLTLPTVGMAPAGCSHVAASAPGCNQAQARTARSGAGWITSISSPSGASSHSASTVCRQPSTTTGGKSQEQNRSTDAVTFNPWTSYLSVVRRLGAGQ